MRQGLFIISLCASIACVGQIQYPSVDTIQLDTSPIHSLHSIDIVQYRIDKQQFLFSSELQKMNPAASFSKLLQMQSGIFIKSQGVGTLSTPSYKGLGSAHLPITISGYSMQSSMNVNTDLSLISSFHFDIANFNEVGFNRTIATNMGPSLDLRSSNRQRNEVLVNTSSLGLKTIGYATSKYIKEGSITFSAITQHSPNRINLKIYGRDSLLKNTAFLNNSIFFRLNKVLRPSLFYSNVVYLQYSERQIPSSLYSLNDGKQKDLNLMIGNKFTYKAFQNVSLAFDNQVWEEHIDYSSEMRNNTTKSKVFNSNSNLQFKAHKFKENKLSKLDFGIFHAFNFYRSQALKTQVQRNILRFNVHAEKSFGNKGFVEFSPATVLSDNKLHLAAMLKLQRTTKLKHSFTLEAQKVLRLPSLNERYWYEPGFALGNANLEPESGYKLDLYYRLAEDGYFLSINPFAAYYDNIIMWIGYPVIQATNIQKVLSRGVVLSFNRRFTTQIGVFKVNHNQHWVWSTYADKNSTISPHGKQLIFTPILNSNITVTYLIGRFGVYINQSYTGKNYYSSDNSSYLDPFSILDLGAYREFNRFKISAAINNVLNSPYFSIPNQPLPGINGEINLNFYFNKRKK